MKIINVSLNLEKRFYIFLHKPFSIAENIFSFSSKFIAIDEIKFYLFFLKLFFNEKAKEKLGKRSRNVIEN